jgi:hypothetical protein
MRKLFVLAGLLSCTVLVLGCPKKKVEGADAAAEALPTPVADAAATPAAVTAKNAADVARFPGETPPAADDRKIAQFTPARTSPKAGNVVTTLKPGSEVTRVAEFQGSLLVTFADPKDASATLMGWIGHEAFTAAVIHDAGVKSDAGRPDAGAVKLVCAAGTVAVILSQDPNPICKKKCTKDADCKGIGNGTCVNATGVTGTVVRACVG